MGSTLSHPDGRDRVAHGTVEGWGKGVNESMAKGQGDSLPPIPTLASLIEQATASPKVTRVYMSDGQKAIKALT